MCYSTAWIYFCIDVEEKNVLPGLSWGWWARIWIFNTNKKMKQKNFLCKFPSFPFLLFVLVFSHIFFFSLSISVNIGTEYISNCSKQFQLQQEREKHFDAWKLQGEILVHTDQFLLKNVFLCDLIYISHSDLASHLVTEALINGVGLSWVNKVQEVDFHIIWRFHNTSFSWADGTALNRLQHLLSNKWGKTCKSTAMLLIKYAWEVKWEVESMAAQSVDSDSLHWIISVLKNIVYCMLESIISFIHYLSHENHWSMCCLFLWPQKSLSNT